MNPYRLILIGIGATLTFSAFADLLIARMDALSAADMAKWLIGTLNARSWSDVLRVTIGLGLLLPVIIWLTLYFTAVMSMIVVGYQAGLSLKRSPVATYSLALAFAAVMMLIMDLDRPLQSLFEIDGAVMEQLAIFMRSEL